MKKYIALLLALVMALSLCACAETEKPTPTDNSTTATTSGTVPSEPTTPSEPTDEGNFFVVTQIKNHIIGDEDSFVTVDVTYDENYNVIGFNIYENDALTETYTFNKSVDKPLLVQNYGEDGAVESREEYTYDENGNLLTAHSYFGDKMTTEAIYTYDEHGNTLTKYYDNGEEDWTETYENIYENGVLTEVKIHSHDLLQERYLYDSDGNELLHAYYYFGEEGTRYESTYENGKLVLMVDYSDGEETSREEYTYNANGDLLTRISKTEGIEDHRQENIYNATGQLVEIKHLNSDGHSANTVYTYAADGSLDSIKAYDEGKLKLESTFTSRKATVSKEQAKYLTSLLPQLMEEWT